MRCEAYSTSCLARMSSDKSANLGGRENQDHVGHRAWGIQHIYLEVARHREAGPVKLLRSGGPAGCWEGGRVWIQGCVILNGTSTCKDIHRHPRTCGGRLLGHATCCARPRRPYASPFPDFFGSSAAQAGEESMIGCNFRPRWESYRIDDVDMGAKGDKKHKLWPSMSSMSSSPPVES